MKKPRVAKAENDEPHMRIPLACMMKGRVWPFQQHSQWGFATLSLLLSTQGSGGWKKRCIQGLTWLS